MKRRFLIQLTNYHFNMCDKIPYDSKADAREAAKGMGHHSKGSMRWYYCHQCEAWHIATEGKKKRKWKRKMKYPFRYIPVNQKNKLCPPKKLNRGRKNT